jgi:hypothetical protein
MLTVTDLVTAKRLGLSTAKLINPNGQHIEATTESINAAISEFAASGVPGVKVSTAALEKDESYPLSTLTYAAVDVCRATLPELVLYQSLLTFISGKGQIIGNNTGEIPEGYIPLDKAQIAQVKKTAGVIAKEVSTPVCVQHVTPTTAAPTATPSETTDVGGTPDTDAAAGPTVTFPGDPNSALRYSMLSALCFGIPMIAGGRTLIRRAKTI